MQTSYIKLLSFQIFEFKFGFVRPCLAENFEIIICNSKIILNR